MPVLRFSWLGPPAVEVDGRPLRLEMRKTLALLAYLSFSPQSIARETLATLFWPEFDQQHSLTNLRRNLFSLSRSLPPGLLEADREKISLRKADWLRLDVAEFREQLSRLQDHSHSPGRACPDCLARLEKAVAEYKGDFLEGFNLRDCPGFDEWQSYQRENLRSEYASALERLASIYQDQGEWEKAVRTARSRVALDPLNEAAQRMLIRLYQQSGQRSLALRQYETLVDELHNELGQAPEAETLALYQSLLPDRAPGIGQNGSAQPRSTSLGAEPLIKTKLFIPPLRANRIARPRLLELLDAASQRSLTLLSAPAGFGKTTLLASWAAHTSLPIAWFSIDEADNDPGRFVAYLIAALDSALEANLSEQFQSFMQALQPSVQPTLVQLINHLSGEPEPFVLILDDYQFIHSENVHKAVAFLLENTPPCLHLVISTRSDPPLALALLRGRDQLVEIRMSDLRFRPEESAGFLQQVMALQLSNEDVSALEARTEGWIAGLQMAALAIRSVAAPPVRDSDPLAGGQAVSRFIQAFSGSNRYILDYLGEEVLSRSSEETRRFLLQTSILERFSAPLCEAVTGSKGSQQLLEEMEKENLFTVPLDSERHWYRYHHLFAELLFYKLEETLSTHSELERDGWPSLEELHLRAAGWLEKNQLFSEAVRHFLAAKRYDQAAALIEVQAKPMLLKTGQIYTLLDWFAELPADLFLSRPRLTLARAWISIVQDQFTAALEQLETARLVVQDRGDAEADSILGEIALMHGVLAELHDRDVEAMRTCGLLAWEKLPEEDSMMRGLAAWLLGASYYFDGDTRLAEYYLSEAIRLCQEAGNVFFTSVAIQEFCNVRMEQGRYREAYQLLSQTLQEMSSGSQRSHPSLGYLYYALSRILWTWNELAEAERQLKLGIDLMAQDIPGEMLLLSISLLPAVLFGQGKREEATRLAEACLQRAEAYPSPNIAALVKANLVRFWIRAGDRERIEEWLGNCGLNPVDPIRSVREVEYIAFAKVLLWQRQSEEALKLLARLHGLAQGQGRNGKLFHILALEALARMQSGDPDGALNALEASLMMARSEGYIRPYVDEGQPMEVLLQLGASCGTWHQTHLDAYVDRLLKSIRVDRAQVERPG